MKTLQLASRMPGIVKSIRKNRRGDVDLPRFLTYIVSFRCNARCVMCDSWKIPGQNELTLDDLEGILRQLPRLDAVRLSGGEPFLRKDFPQIANLVTRVLRPLFLHVTTNGFSTDRIAQFVEQRDARTPLEMLLSIDGYGTKHNEVRGRSTAWARVNATLDAILPMRESHNLSLTVNQVIVDEEGHDHYRKLRDALAPRGVTVQPVLAYDESATYSIEREREDTAPSHANDFRPFGALSNDWVLRFLEEVEADTATLPRSNRIAKQFYLRNVRDRIRGTASASSLRCVALSSHLRLFPNGDVPTCQFNGKIVGNLRDQAFREVWNGVKAEEQRKWVRGCPGCLAECEMVPNAIYTGAILRDALPV